MGTCSLEGWPESCIYKLLAFQYNSDEEDFNQRFSSQPGVNTTLPDFGSTLCAPIPYEPMYLFFEAVGYTVGERLLSLEASACCSACFAHDFTTQWPNLPPLVVL